MLELGHPRTPHVFAACTQYEIVLEDCKRMTLADARGRKFRLEDVRPALAALRWLAGEQFAEVAGLPAAITELERRIEQLAGLPLRREGTWVGSAVPCPACDSTIPEAHGDPVRYCSQCLDIIWPALWRIASCEEGFGIEGI
jgi:hypothetical protein